MTSEWLSPDGRRAAELLGPIDVIGSDCRYHISIEGDRWLNDIYALDDSWDDSSWLADYQGHSIQNDHARRRLADDNIYVRPDGAGDWTIAMLGNDGYEYLWDGEKFTDGGDWATYLTYESALIAAVLAVFTKE